MREAILHLPEPRLARERQRELQAAIRQLDRAEIYLAAVAYMELDDRAAKRALRQLRADLNGLLRHFGEHRDRIPE